MILKSVTSHLGETRLQLSKMLDSGDYSDIDIYCGDDRLCICAYFVNTRSSPIKAHKVVLAAGSTLFYNLLVDNKESYNLKVKRLNSTNPDDVAKRDNDTGKDKAKEETRIRRRGTLPKQTWCFDLIFRIG